MRLDAPPRRRAAENIVPMINVVFLLLIFFLMTSQIAPPEPIEVSPPTAELEAPRDAELTLYIGADGEVAYRDERGDAAIAAVAARADAGALSIRADAAVEASEVAALLPRLAEAGFASVTLVTAAP